MIAHPLLRIALPLLTVRPNGPRTGYVTSRRQRIAVMTTEWNWKRITHPRTLGELKVDVVLSDRELVAANILVRGPWCKMRIGCNEKYITLQ
jgi:hypothetical protein